MKHNAAEQAGGEDFRENYYLVFLGRSSVAGPAPRPSCAPARLPSAPGRRRPRQGAVPVGPGLRVAATPPQRREGGRRLGHRAGRRSAGRAGHPPAPAASARRRSGPGPSSRPPPAPRGRRGRPARTPVLAARGRAGGRGDRRPGAGARRWAAPKPGNLGPGARRPKAVETWWWTGCGGGRSPGCCRRRRGVGTPRTAPPKLAPDRALPAPLAYRAHCGLGANPLFTGLDLLTCLLRYSDCLRRCFVFILNSRQRSQTASLPWAPVSLWGP